MKKIVALVLALVLALSLATVAFGAVTPEAGKVYGLNDDGTLTGGGDAVTLIAAKAPTATARGNVAFYSGVAKNYAVVDKADATCVLYTGTSYVYLDEATCFYYNVNPGYVLAYECPTTATCGKLTAGNGAAAIVSKTDALGNVTYYKANKATVETTALTNTTYLFGDTLYTIDTANAMPDAVTGATTHDWEVVTRNATTGAVETVGCTRCGAKGVIVTEADYALLAAAQKGGLMNGTSYVKITSAAAADKGVSSAKTFDAGVALYAGMALMSVAGSAVVIGKKKEF